MATIRLADNEQFSPAVRASMMLLFERLHADRIEALVFFCSDKDGHPLVVFNGAFTDAACEFLGDALTGIIAMAEVKDSA